MDNERMSRMADRVAQGEANDEPLVVLDQAVDSIITAITAIDEVMSDVKPENDKEKKALGNNKDIMETAIVPYMGDVVKEMEAFEAE